MSRVVWNQFWLCPHGANPLARVFVLSLAIAACGGSSSGGGGNSDPGTDAGADLFEDVGTIVGSGDSTTETIGAGGGTVTVGEASVSIPAGALASDVVITMTETTSSPPDGYRTYSPIYRFDPEGLTFAVPVSITLPFQGSGRFAAAFWSWPDGPGYERKDEAPGVGSIQFDVGHFSTGFVANAVDYTDPPDRSCVQADLIEGRTVTPSGVALFFTVEDCVGRPITGLEDDDFILFEDGVPLSVEADSVILPQPGLQVFVSLVLDMSSSTNPLLPELIEGAKTFVTRLMIDDELPIQVSIELFAGERGLTQWQAPTLDAAKLLVRLDSLASYTPSDPASTNLNGAVIEAVARNESAQRDFRDRNYGGAFTAGYLVLFTDGGDTAAINTHAAAVAAVNGTDVEVLAVGLDSPDYDLPALTELAPGGVITSADAATLARDFGTVANRIAGQLSGIYLLGYCSPKRAGLHTVTVEVEEATNAHGVSYEFDAAGFGPGCSATLFETICDGLSCGGRACGACDERVASCDPSTFQCVSFCDQQALCGGRNASNPHGYDQVCSDSPPERVDCGGECADLTSDPNHCGDCDEVCAADSPCYEGECLCPGMTRGLNCGGSCTETWSNPLHCGECDNSCGVGGSCERDTCSCPGMTRGENCSGVCTETWDNDAHCGACGVRCPTGAVCSGDTCDCAGMTAGIDCGGVCTETWDSPTNCGDCGNTCSAGQACIGDECRCPGLDGMTCEGGCVDADSDADYCGDCDTTCIAGCVGGACHNTVIDVSIRVTQLLAVVSGPESGGAAFWWHAVHPTVAAQPLPQRDGLSIVRINHSHTGTAQAIFSDQSFRVLGVDGEDGTMRWEELEGISHARDVCSGSDHDCVVTLDRGVTCWGRNDSAQLGQGSAGTMDDPAGSVTGLSDDVEAISCGWSHTCALLSDETVECWGSNNSGEIGATTPNPVTAATPVPDLTGIRELASGAGFSCARNEGGTVYCWGANNSAQTGIGSNEPFRYVPPTAVDDLPSASQIAATDHTICALAGGVPYCWGQNLECSIRENCVPGEGNDVAPTQVAELTGQARIVAGILSPDLCFVSDTGLLTCQGTYNTDWLPLFDADW